MSKLALVSQYGQNTSKHDCVLGFHLYLFDVVILWYFPNLAIKWHLLYEYFLFVYSHCIHFYQKCSMKAECTVLSELLLLS